MKYMRSPYGVYAGEDGNLYILHNGQYRQMKIIPSTHKGYKRVSILSRVITVHSIVCGAWHGPRKKGMVCRHLNGNPSDNRPSNLSWGTPTENEKDKIIHDTYRCGEKINSSILKKDDIWEIRTSFDSRKNLAKKFKVSIGCISDVISRRTWKHLL